MKNRFTLSAVALATCLSGPLAASELAYLYKDPRVQARGGAAVAVGGLGSALFSNPAGLSYIQSEDLVVELLGLSTTGSENVDDVIDDIDDAIDQEDSTEALLQVFEKYSGERFHTDVSNYSSVSYNHGQWAWSMGLLAAADANFVPHANGGVSGFLETQARGYAGITAGLSRRIEFEEHTLSLGVGAKLLKQKSFEGPISIDDLVNSDDLVDAIRDKLERNSDGIGYDLGLIYQFNAWPLQPSFGVSVLNLGDMGFDNSYGKQPTTVNLGVALHPEMGVGSNWVIAVDYVDLLNENQTRFFDLEDEDDQVAFTDVTDDDVEKRIRFGVSTRLFDLDWTSMDLAAGVYQGNVTGGLELYLAGVRLGLSTYAEELGPKAGDYDDRRYTLNLGIAW